MLALFAVLALTACGKKGDPMPDNSRLLFSLRNVTAVVTGPGCVSVAGSVSGSSANVESLVLELQPFDDACAGCPFVPQETYRVSAAEAWNNPGGNAFDFSYCPAARADAYRWRLTGRNANTGQPPVMTPPRVVRKGMSAE